LAVRTGPPKESNAEDLMKVHRLLALALIICSIAATSSAQQNPSDTRVALLIANSNYPDASAPLPTASKDARTLGDELKRLGFDVDTRNNLGKAETQKALDAFIAKIKRGSTALFFFSGFGIQVSRQSYLIPTDAQIWTEAEVPRDGTSLDQILTKMTQAGASAKIMIIDASRRNPYERRFRGLSNGLAALDLPDGTLAIYAAATDKVANDSDGANSIFLAQLLTEMRNPGINAEAVFNRTRVDVSRLTNGEQVPWVASSMLDEYFFESSGSAAATEQTELTRTNVTKPSPPPDKTSTPATVTDPAIEKLNARLQQNPNDAIAFYNRGQLYAKNGDFSSAVADFDQAIRLSPNDAAAFNNRCWARAASSTGELDLALRDCNEALRLRPDFTDALDSRGLTYLKLKLNALALADYDAALRLKPNQASSLYGRGISKLRSGKVAEGNADIAAAKALDARIAEEFAAYGVH
jgi:tetratricopeptide (TPR) repeat protein